MKQEQADKLRAAFPPAVIGKLPKAGIMLDYVGHAAVTDRLLQVDPEWTWEPMATDDHGAPLVVHGGIWIKLTICGVTRPGFGDGKNPKEMIGDAIRNAAMRFGVALDLWAKEDLHGSEGEPSAGQAGTVAAAPKASAPTGGQGRGKQPSSFKAPASVNIKASVDSITELYKLTEELGAKEATEKTVAEREEAGTLTQEWVDRCIAAAKKNIETKKQAA